MKMPQPSAGYEQRVHFGRYTAACLKKARRADQAAQVEQATNKVKVTGRKVEDAVEPVQTATALRDASDGDMDVAGQEFRKQLAARRLGAEREPPYTNIFPKGIGYYTAAPLAENVNRYNELITRVETNLTEDDALRVALVPAITAGLADYTAATTELASVRTALSVARTECDAAQDEWESLIVKIYGNLITDFGKKAAERFFPKARRTDPGDDVEEPTTPDQP